MGDPPHRPIGLSTPADRRAFVTGPAAVTRWIRIRRQIMVIDGTRSGVHGWTKTDRGLVDQEPVSADLLAGSTLTDGGVSPLVTLGHGRRIALTPTGPPHRRPAHRGRGPRRRRPRHPTAHPEVASATMRGTYVRRQLDHWCAFPGPGRSATAARRHLTLHLRPAFERRWWRWVRAAENLRSGHVPVTAVQLPAHPRWPSVIFIDHPGRGAGRPEVAIATPHDSPRPPVAPPSWSAAADADLPPAGAHAPETRAGRRIIIGHGAPTSRLPHHLHQHRRPHPTGREA